MLCLHGPRHNDRVINKDYRRSNRAGRRIGIDGNLDLISRASTTVASMT